MTAAEFTAWRKRLGYTQAQAADALGMSRRQVQYYEDGSQAVPRVVELACGALESGIRDQGSQGDC